MHVLLIGEPYTKACPSDALAAMLRAQGMRVTFAGRVRSVARWMAMVRKAHAVVLIS